MIISHRHKFIFLKTRKTGGTSIELALSEICGPEDVITWVGQDEKHRRGLGPQNCEPERNRLPILMRMRLALGAEPEKVGAVYRNHFPAASVKRLVGETVWNSYFKFSIERNPWDRQVSYYHFLHRDPATRPDFGAYLTDPAYKARMNNFSIYALADNISVDTVMRFEEIGSEYAAVMARLGIANPPELRHAKGKSRVDKRDYRTYFTPDTRQLIADWYEKEIDAFGYTFDDFERGRAP